MTARSRGWPSLRTLVILGAGVAVLIAQAVIPFPYVIERPGQLANTLGSVRTSDGEVPMIQIEGHPSYDTSGELNLLTVSISGNPEQSVSGLELFAAWIDPTQEILPMELIYPQGVTREQREQQNAQLMTSSQDDATAAALNELGIPFGERLIVMEVNTSSDAQGQIEPGDQLLALNGEQLDDYTELRAAITANGDQRPAEVTVLRGDQELTVSVTPQTMGEGAEQAVVLGLGVRTEYEFPFTVDIMVDQIGGPSAGTIFALGIVDKLTPEALVAGRKIAGTGTISGSGVVGEIGGLTQKLVSANRAGNELAFIPHSQCTDFDANVIGDLRIVPIRTLGEAVDALEELNSGAALNQLPACDGLD